MEVSVKKQNQTVETTQSTMKIALLKPVVVKIPKSRDPYNTGMAKQILSTFGIRNITDLVEGFKSHKFSVGELIRNLRPCIGPLYDEKCKLKKLICAGKRHQILKDFARKLVSQNLIDTSVSADTPPIRPNGEPALHLDPNCVGTRAARYNLHSAYWFNIEPTETVLGSRYQLGQALRPFLDFSKSSPGLDLELTAANKTVIKNIAKLMHLPVPLTLHSRRELKFELRSRGIRKLEHLTLPGVSRMLPVQALGQIIHEVALGSDISDSLLERYNQGTYPPLAVNFSLKRLGCFSPRRD